MVKNVSAFVVQPTEKPRKIVMMFISSLPAVLQMRSTTPDSFIRLPSISIPISGAEAGRMSEIRMVHMIGKIIFSVRDTCRSCVMTMLRSFFVVSSFMMGGCMTGTSAI